MSKAFDSSCQFATGGSITLTDRVAVYDYKKYTDRMLGLSGDSPTMVDGSIENGANWKWPGEAGHSMVSGSTPMPFKRLPRRTKDSVERLGFKNSGETIDIQTVLWAGDDLVWNRGKFQAVKFSFNGKDAFSWVVYDNKIYYESPENERILHEITDDELINGFIPEHGNKYKLIFPAIKVVISMNDGSYSEDDKYILTGFDELSNEVFKMEQIVKKDKIDNGGIKELIFNGTPKKLLYTLKVEPGTDQEGNKPKEKILFEKKLYYSK